MHLPSVTMSSHTSPPGPRALELFARLAALPMPEDLDPLRDEIDRHLLSLQKLARQNEMMPIDLAEGIAAGLHTLFDALTDLPTDHQAAVLGAARYFISEEDELPDRESILGLDDDASIFNHVVRLIGRPDLQVDP